MPENMFKRGRTWWGRTQVAGKELRRSLRTTDRDEAKKRRNAWLKELDHEAFHGEARHTYKEAVVIWSADYLPGNVKPRTAERYLSSVRQLDPHFADSYIDQIDRKAVTKYVTAAKARGVTNATIRRDLSALSSILAFCVSQGWREDNPARVFDRTIIKERRSPIVMPQDADIDLVVSLARQNLACLIRAAQYTGMRQNELAGLERREIDYRRQAVMLTETKTNKPRSVPLDERAVGTFVGTPPHLKSNVVFWHGAKGKPYQEVSSRFNSLVRRAVKLAKDKGLKFRRFKFHDLRHWYAVDYLRRGGSIYDLQQILGHSSIKTTELYLNYLTPDEQDHAKRSAQKPAQRTTVSGTVAG